MQTTKKISLAITDDHDIILETLSQCLASYDEFNIDIQASNGKELLNKLNHSKLLPDICILDIDMPKLNGYETLLEIRRTYPHIKVLMLTGYDNEFTVIKLLQNGANGYLTKRSPIRELYNAILEVYTNDYYHSKIISRTLSHYLKENRNNIALEINNKEYEFLALCCTDLSYKEIADRMSVGIRTVDGYRESLFSMLKINSRIGLAMFAMQTGIYKRIIPQD